MKPFVTRLGQKRGITLIELVVAMVLSAIIMAAILSFTLFTSSTTVMALTSSSVQNEMRLIMRYIKEELVAATGGRIKNGAGYSDLTSGPSDETRVLFSFEGGGDSFGIAMIQPGGDVVRVIDFIELPYLEVNFKPKDGNKFMLVVTLTYNDPNDPRLFFELRDEILLTNYRDVPPTEWYYWDGTKWITNAIVREPFPAPPGGGDSLIITSYNPLP